MTDPIEAEAPERQTRTVPLAGHEFLVRELEELQMMHLARYAKILMRDDVGPMAKVDASERMLSILHTALPDDEQRLKLIDLEEEGKVGLRDLIAFSRSFREEAKAPVTVVRRRGRPRKSA